MEEECTPPSLSSFAFDNQTNITAFLLYQFLCVWIMNSVYPLLLSFLHSIQSFPGLTMHSENFCASPPFLPGTFNTLISLKLDDEHFLIWQQVLAS